MVELPAADALVRGNVLDRVRQLRLVRAEIELLVLALALPPQADHREVAPRGDGEVEVERAVEKLYVLREDLGVAHAQGGAAQVGLDLRVARKLPARGVQRDGRRGLGGGGGKRAAQEPRGQDGSHTPPMSRRCRRRLTMVTATGPPGLHAETARDPARRMPGGGTMDTRVRAAGFLGLSLAFSASTFASPDALPQKGIELSDMDRSVEACTDFFEFANGAWRAANPMPASMSRWSRRWKAGEDAKEQPEGDPRRDRGDPDPPKGSVDQLIGDFYGACMNQAERNRLGVKPLGNRARRDRRHGRHRRPPEDDRPVHRTRDLGAVRLLRRLRQPQARRRDRADLRPAAWGCRTATTTSSRRRASSRRARSTSPTSRRSSGSPAIPRSVGRGPPPRP